MKHRRIIQMLVLDLADQIRSRHPELERIEAVRRASEEISMIVPHDERLLVRAMAS